MPLTDDLISYWAFDELSGTALDSHGSNDLTAVNAPGSGTGKIESGRTFDGSNQRFTHADNAALSTGDVAFTFHGWAKADSWGGNRRIFCKINSSITTLEYQFFQNAGTQLRFEVFNGFSQVGQAVFDYDLTDTWFRFCCWHDPVADQIGLQIDDETPVVNSSGAPADTSAEFYVGSLGGLSFFDGVIDELGFWKRVLTSDERAALWNDGAGFAYPFGDVPVPDVPDGDIDSTADSAGTFGTHTDGSAVFQDTTVEAAWWLDSDSQTGFEERKDGWIHFPTVALPNDATIVAAYLGLTRPQVIYDDFNDEPHYPGTIYGHEDDDPAAVADTSDGLSKIASLTTAAKVIPDQDGVAGPDYNWYDVTDIVEEIRSDGGHADGDDMQFFLRNVRPLRTGGPDVWATSYGWGGTDIASFPHLAKPRLIIDYSVPEHHFASGSVTATATTSASASLSGEVSASISATATTSAHAVRHLFASASAEAEASTTAASSSAFKRSASIAATAMTSAHAVVSYRVNPSILATASTFSHATQDYLGSASASAIASTSVLADIVNQRSASIVAAATTQAIATQVYRTSASIWGTASSHANALRSLRASASVEAEASSSVVVHKTKPVSASITATGTVSSLFRLFAPRSGAVTGTASTSCSAVRSLKASASIDASASASTITSVTKSTSVAIEATASTSSVVSVTKPTSASIQCSATTSASALQRHISRPSIHATASTFAVPIATRPTSASIQANVMTHIHAVGSYRGSSSVHATASTQAIVRVTKPTSASIVGSTSSQARALQRFRAFASVCGTASTNGHALQSYRTSAASSAIVSTRAKGLMGYRASASVQGTATTQGTYWMHIGEATKEYLLSVAPLSALVGSRIYPHYWTIADGSPAIVYQFERIEHDHVFRRPSGVAVAEATFSIFARTRAEIVAVANALHEAIVDYKGRWGTKEILHVAFGYESDNDDVEGYRFRSIDYTAQYRESRPFRIGEVLESTESLEDALVKHLSDLAPTYAEWIDREEIAANVIRFRRSIPERGATLPGEDGFERVSVDIAVRSRRANEVYRIANSIRTRIDGLVGHIEGAGVLACLLQDEEDSVDFLDDGSERPYFEVIQTYLFAVERFVPAS